jgi:hypothetical protein
MVNHAAAETCGATGLGATEEEPIFRQFFTQLAQQCGRPVVL